MKNYFITFFIIFLCNISFADDHDNQKILLDYYSKNHWKYVDKYEEERKEKYIALEAIKELEVDLDETNKNLEILEKEKDILEKNNKKLSEVKNIQINSSSVIIILSALLLLIFIILYLSLIISKQRKWRKEYFDENNNKFIGVLPERIADTIDKSEEAYNSLKESNHKQYDNFNQNLQQVANLINQVNNVNTENVSKINDQLSALRKFSDEKNELVKKYQEFYDFGIIKSYILETISTIDHLEDSVRELENKNHPQESIEAVNFAKLKLVTILENDNINQVQPNLEMTFNDSKQPVKCKVNKKTVSNENTAGTIKSIMHSGYVGQISKDKEFVTIRPAYVNIYINKTQEEN